MGGDLTNGPAGKAPTFMIRALRDPDGANLDRVQVIKGWLDGKETHERIYDVACSDGRAIVNRRCEREVGSTVDVADASYTNSIGDVMLMAHWEDPDFDPISAPSTTCASSRSPPRAGRPTTRSGSGSRCPTRSR